MTTFKTMAMVILMAACVAPLQAEIFNPGESLDGFSAAGFASGDFIVTSGIGPNGIGASGITGDTAVQFVPRADNSHTMAWNEVDGAVVDAFDTLTLDVRSLLLGNSTLMVDVYYDELSTPHVGYTGVILSAAGSEPYTNIIVTMPSGGNHTLDRIDFSAPENTKIIQLDNLTLTTVPEPTACFLLGIGLVTLLAGVRRRSR